MSIVLLLLGAVGLTFAQDTRSINVGNLYYSVNEFMNGDDIDWDRSQSRHIPGDERDMLDVHGYALSMLKDWTHPGGANLSHMASQAAFRKYTDFATMHQSRTFWRKYRVDYPTKILDGTDWTPSIEAGDAVDNTLPADVVIYSEIDIWPLDGGDMTLERWIYGFTNSDHDDYVIEEWVFTNTSSAAQNGVYIDLRAQTSADAFYPGDLSGDYYGATYQQYVAGDNTADSLRLWYSWDAFDRTTATIDTKGKPDSQWGNLEEAQYFGHVIIHADDTPADETDSGVQPWKAGWSQRDMNPNMSEAGPEVIYEFHTTGWSAVNPGLGPTGYSETVDGTGTVITTGTFLGPYRRMKKSKLKGEFDDYDPLYNSETEQEKSGTFVFGPLDFGPSDDYRIVTAFAGGSMPGRYAIDLGRAYKNGSTAQFDLVPTPRDILGPDGNVLLAAGSTLDFVNTADRDLKNKILDDWGIAMLLENVAKARDTWNNGNVRNGAGSFGLDVAPASPSLTGYSEGDQVRLVWGSEAESDADAGTIVGYRIYRDYKRVPPSTTHPIDTTFVLLVDEEVLPKGTLTYTDKAVARGEDYYYYVVAVNDKGLESSPWLNRTGTSAKRTDEALRPTRSPDAQWQDNVVVVPNPYHISGVDKYPGRKLNFLNLPGYADIKIYTMTGDLIQTLKHDANTGDQAWIDQDTFATMEIVSGVYIYVVEELNAAGSPTGEITIGKFVVVK